MQPVWETMTFSKPRFADLLQKGSEHRAGAGGDAAGGHADHHADVSSASVRAAPSVCCIFSRIALSSSRLFIRLLSSFQSIVSGAGRRVCGRPRFLFGQISRNPEIPPGRPEGTSAQDPRNSRVSTAKAPPCPGRGVPVVQDPCRGCTEGSRATLRARSPSGGQSMCRRLKHGGARRCPRPGRCGCRRAAAGLLRRQPVEGGRPSPTFRVVRVVVNGIGDLGETFSAHPAAVVGNGQHSAASRPRSRPA